MENYAIKGRGGNDVQHKDWKGKILRIWIKIIRHGGLGHEVQESWPYLSNATPWPCHLGCLGQNAIIVSPNIAIKGGGRPTRLLPHAKMLLILMKFFFSSGG